MYTFGAIERRADNTRIDKEVFTSLDLEQQHDKTDN